MDTIFALATAPGRAGVAVIRVSGPSAFNACLHLCGDVPAVRKASVRTLSDQGEVIDEALVLVFGSGQSFTGEKTVEFQTHGSPAVVRRLLVALGRLVGLRMAEAGEFTRRALENDRLDLARVEGLSDLLEAETEAQRKQAVRVFSGELGQKVEVWRKLLLRAAALVEASIDFAEEEVPENVYPEVLELVSNLQAEFGNEIKNVSRAEQIRQGFEVAIVGPPNAGKSTLLNRLAGREAAITSEIAGTTRDVIEVRMDLSGIAVTFLDTAGLRETEDTLEAMGIERARQRAVDADMRVFLGNVGQGLAICEGDVLVAEKSDLGVFGDGLPVSGKTGAGVGQLLSRIESVLHDRVAGSGTATRRRHADALCRAVESLDRAESAIHSADVFEELIAEELRGAVRAVDGLVGRIGVEDVLGEIFGSFCIGK